MSFVPNTLRHLANALEALDAAYAACDDSMASGGIINAESEVYRALRAIVRSHRARKQSFETATPWSSESLEPGVPETIVSGLDLDIRSLSSRLEVMPWRIARNLPCDLALRLSANEVTELSALLSRALGDEHV